MTQSFSTSITGTAKNALKTLLPNNDEALRTLHSGASEPSSMVAYMLWADTTNALLKQRNSGNSAWTVLAPLNGNAGRITMQWNLGTVNATANTDMIMLPAKATIIRVGLWSDTTSTGSVTATTEYRFQVRNLTTSVNLFSAGVGTGTVLGGVGGGEITANTPYWLTANQNANTAEGDRLQFQVTKTGSPTSLTKVMLVLDAYERG